MKKKHEKELFCDDCGKHVTVAWPFESYFKCCEDCGGETSHKVCYYEHETGKYVIKE